jgi:hypothetical protein
LNTKESAVEINGGLVHVTKIDWEKRNWRRIYAPEEEGKWSVAYSQF